MKKQAITLTVCLLSTAAALAQTFNLGAKAGLNFSQMNNTIPSSYSASSGATGITGGVFGRVGFAGFFVQPEVLFSQRKGAFTSSVDGTAVINTLSYIDIPVLVGYKIAFARVNMGPNFQNLIAAKQKATDQAKDPNFNKENFNTTVVGYQVGVGVDLLKLTLDVRYDGSFGKLGKEIINASGKKVDYGSRAGMWQVTLGFKFL